MSIALAQAYRLCESITRERASNFYYGIRLLPRDRRRAMCAVYAFARRVDDIADGPLEPAEKLALLEEAEASLAPLMPPRAHAHTASLADPVLVALLHARERFGFPAEALVELIEGVRMDVRGTAYEDFDGLVLYCRRVAGTIGRVSLAIFMGGSGCDERCSALADDLGVALQLTNILRDLREDAGSGRVYLPVEDLRGAGLSDLPSALRRAESDPGVASAVAELVRAQARRAQEWFDRGMLLVALLDRRSGACVLAMAGIYRRLLGRIAADPSSILRGRVSLSAPEKAWVAARAMVGRPAGGGPR